LIKLNFQNYGLTPRLLFLPIKVKIELKTNFSCN